jgi:hypothetical protein
MYPRTLDSVGHFETGPLCFEQTVAVVGGFEPDGGKTLVCQRLTDNLPSGFQ